VLQPEKPEDVEMDREQQFIADLKSLETKSQPDESAFVAREIAEARLTGRVATRLWATGDAAQAYQAHCFLIDIEDLALVPLLEGPLRDDPNTLSQAMFLLVQRETELRRRIVVQLDLWLDDKRAVPLKPVLLPTEVRPRPRRVCDEAYVAMRKLVYFGEDDIRQMVDEDRLYELSEPQRDEAIARARASKSWRLVVDPDSGD
jgi:hypothetical protein